MKMKKYLFLKKTPVSILLGLNNVQNKNCSCLARKFNCTYLTFLILIKKFESVGLVTTKRDGRDRIVNITKKGKFIATHLINLDKQLGGEKKWSI